jgi:hypothetical protein
MREVRVKEEQKISCTFDEGFDITTREEKGFKN